MFGAASGGEVCYSRFSHDAHCGPPNRHNDVARCSRRPASAQRRDDRVLQRKLENLSVALSMVYIDVTGACKSPRSTGIQRVTRRIFQELARRIPITPISWNLVGNRYQFLGRREHAILEQPARFLTRPAARPELRGEYFPAELHRQIFRKSIQLQGQLQPDDVLLLPDIFRDGRLRKLPPLISETTARSVAIFHDAAALRLSLLNQRARAKFERYITSLAKFDLVVCVSEASRNDLLQLWAELGATPTQAAVETWPVEPFGPNENLGSNQFRP